MHAGQRRQLDGAPFIEHPLEVAAILHDAGAPDHVIAAGILHDTLEKTDAGFSITAIHLDVTVKIPGADKAKFDEAAKNAEKGCPVSRVLNAAITMDAHLVA